MAGYLKSNRLIAALLVPCRALSETARTERFQRVIIQKG